MESKNINYVYDGATIDQKVYQAKPIENPIAKLYQPYLQKLIVKLGKYSEKYHTRSIPASF